MFGGVAGVAVVSAVRRGVACRVAAGALATACGFAATYQTSGIRARRGCVAYSGAHSPRWLARGGRNNIALPGGATSPNTWPPLALSISLFG